METATERTWPESRMRGRIMRSHDLQSGKRVEIWAESTGKSPGPERPDAGQTNADGEEYTNSEEGEQCESRMWTR